MSQKIIDLVTAVVAPAIPDPYELVDIEYEKIGSDYILSVLMISRWNYCRRYCRPD